MNHYDLLKMWPILMAAIVAGAAIAWIG